MDPISSPTSATLAPGLSAAVQAMLRQGIQPADVEALFQVVGQELSVLYLGQSPEGAKLELPSGLVVTAQGELPFPEGTQLRIRVDAVAGELKLQTLEAKPPAPATLLAPLTQGEAAQLTARLQQATPPPELAPLVQLLRTLGGIPEPVPREAAPSAAGLAKRIAELPPGQIASLTCVMGSSDSNPETLAAKVVVLLKGATESSGSQPEIPGKDTRDVNRVSGFATNEFLVRFQDLLQRADIPQDHRDSLEGWIRSLLTRNTAQSTAKLISEPPRTASARIVTESRILTQTESARAEGAVKAHVGPATHVPEAWEAWVKGSVRALADPAASPREAPFHALQAKEGTAFFEIPMPWANSKPLQLWVEEDAPEKNTPDQEKIRRVLLSLNLTHLGETRVGLQSANGAIAVRIWTEHPGMVESQREGIERELAESGKAVDLRILTLNPGPDGRIPDLRVLVGGTNLHAIG